MTPDDLSSILLSMKARHAELEEQLADPQIYANRFRCRALTRERGHLEDFFRIHDSWTRALRESAENRAMLQTEQDETLRQLIESELVLLNGKIAEAENSIGAMLLPPDPNDSRSAIVEIRPAAGGEEAALFAGTMFRLYSKYAEHRGWKYELLDLSESELGGIKEVTFSLSGDDVFSRMKFESGVHRVQRVPVTETSGRIHTSTITVSVLPEAEDMDDIVLQNEDLEISTFRSSGPGGQNVNRTDSAVRIVHKPSGITVASQQERSQIRNREIAMRILKTKLLEIRQREEARKHADSKRQQVGTGDRSERIRTYNFPQSRVTDHRFGISVHDLPGLLEGGLDLLLDQILTEEGRRNLENVLKGKQP